MKTEQSRLDLIREYELSPDWALFSQETVAAIRACSLATLERDRWIGIGVPYIKMGRLVRYRKADIQAWLNQQQVIHSTSEESAHDARQ